MHAVTSFHSSAVTPIRSMAVMSEYLALERARIYRRLFVTRFGLLAAGCRGWPGSSLAILPSDRGSAWRSVRSRQPGHGSSSSDATDDSPGDCWSCRLRPNRAADVESRKKFISTDAGDVEGTRAPRIMRRAACPPRLFESESQLPSAHSRRIVPLTLTALGVVYGDIGTSVLYAMRECFFGSHSVPPTHDNVLGVLSLIIYSLVLVISVKYVALVMRADNQGEGGVLALTSLMPGRGRATQRRIATGDRAAASDCAGHLRNRAALRRRDDHAGDLRARCDRGSRGRDAAVPAVCGASHRRDSDRRYS